MHENQHRLNLWNRITLLKSSADTLTQRFEDIVRKDGESAPAPSGPTPGAVHVDGTEWKPGDKKKPWDKKQGKKKDEAAP